MLGCFSHVWFFANLWTVARQASLSRGFSRQEYWNALLQGLFSIQGSNPHLLCLLHCRQILYHRAMREAIWLVDSTVSCHASNSLNSSLPLQSHCHLPKEALLSPARNPTTFPHLWSSLSLQNISFRWMLLYEQKHFHMKITESSCLTVMGNKV